MLFRKFSCSLSQKLINLKKKGKHFNFSFFIYFFSKWLTHPRFGNKHSNFSWIFLSVYVIYKLTEVALRANADEFASLENGYVILESGALSRERSQCRDSKESSSMAIQTDWTWKYTSVQRITCCLCPFNTGSTTTANRTTCAKQTPFSIHELRQNIKFLRIASVRRHVACRILLWPLPSPAVVFIHSCLSLVIKQSFNKKKVVTFFQFVRVKAQFTPREKKFRRR